MKTAFRDLDPDAPKVTVRFDGIELALPRGMNLAAALVGAGIGTFRKTPVSGASRGPFCMMGACFDCLVEVEGRTRQACMMSVEDGLEIAMPGGGDDA